MDVTIRIDADVHKLLKIRSAELGVSMKDLANRYLLKGLIEDSDESDIDILEDIARRLNIPLENKSNEMSKSFEYKKPIFTLSPEKESFD